YIICNDVIVKDRIIDYGINSKKVRAIQAFSKQYLDFKPVDLSDDLISFMKARQPLVSSYLLIRPTFDLKTLFHALKEVQKVRPNFGMVVMGSNTTSDDMDPEEVTRLVRKLGLDHHLFWVGDLEHDHFLTILSKTSLFVRTYIYDGVCSSVLEALAFNIPVVACENPHRPAGVFIFKTGDIKDLTKKILQALSQNERHSSQDKSIEVQDTVNEEAQLLLELA
ncbi:MAG: glycosyltransferase, partial [Waddliaceae bacterium]